MALEPITRQEKIIAGQDLTPITRMEKFLKNFGGGGGGLPSGGAPYQQLVTDGDGSAKWEDRLAYSFEDNVEVLPKTSVLVPMAEEDGVYLYKIDVATTFEIGKTYTVVLDETEYHIAAQNSSLLGNLSLVGAGQDTGEPFLFTSSGTLVIKTSGEHTIQITCVCLVYHKLSSEYVQNGDILRVHRNEIMTEDDASVYSRDLIIGKFSFLVWGNIIFRDFELVDSSSVIGSISLTDTFGTKYRVDKNDDGQFYFEDLYVPKLILQVNGGNFGDSTAIQIERGSKTVVISPNTYYGSGPNENTVLFRVENNGIENVNHFEVLGNGTIKTRSVILPSSTEGSTKQFRITVDDTGTISATEVT